MGQGIILKMKDFTPLIVAIIISVGVVCGVMYTDFPNNLLNHGMECDGSIGGGCS